MEKIKAIVLDDEKHCVESLVLDIQRYCPEIEVVAELTSAKECLNAIKRLNPDLLFLDIEMPWMNGFELLEFLYPTEFEVVFVTAYDSYAVQAFRTSAVDYLMKPVDKKDLIDAVEKVRARLAPDNSTDHARIRNLLDNYFSRKKINKISLPDKDGQKFIEMDDILYVEASSNYSNLHLINTNNILVTLTLKNIESKLTDERFVRVHHSFIINLDHVTQFVKADGGCLVMSDGSEVPISRSKRSAVRGIIDSEFN